MTIKRILVSIDGSEGSADALTLAIELADPLAAKLTLLQVIETEDPLPTYDDRVPEGMDRKTFLADRRFAPLESLLRGVKVPWTRRIEEGFAAEVICEVAETGGYDLAVVGSRGLSPVGRVLLGSVSDAVVRKAPCPVLVAR